MSNVQVPIRNTNSLFARSVFFRDINEIDIYIEDTEIGYEKLFTSLFSRVFEGTFKVNRVFPLGGRKEVLEQYNNNIQNIIRPSLFIIDGDLFLLVGDNVSNTEGLYILPFYCIENILIDEDAILEILDDEDVQKEKDELASEFTFELWISENNSSLFDLFIEYALTFSLNQDEQNVAYPLKNLVSDCTGIVDSTKVENRINDLKQKAIDIVGIATYEAKKEDILHRFTASGFQPEDVITAKNFWIPLFFKRFRSIVDSKTQNRILKLRLAKKCSVDKIFDAQNWVKFAS